MQVFFCDDIMTQYCNDVLRLNKQSVLVIIYGVFMLIDKV